MDEIKSISKIAWKSKSFCLYWKTREDSTDDEWMTRIDSYEHIAINLK